MCSLVMKVYLRGYLLYINRLVSIKVLLLKLQGYRYRRAINQVKVIDAVLLVLIPYGWVW